MVAFVSEIFNEIAYAESNDTTSQNFVSEDNCTLV
jgi:hypothetical protein